MQQMSLHSPEQIEAKKQAIRIAASSFAEHYIEGLFKDADELLVHFIENLHSLVVELKRG